MDFWTIVQASFSSSILSLQDLTSGQNRFVKYALKNIIAKLRQADPSNCSTLEFQGRDSKQNGNLQIKLQTRTLSFRSRLTLSSIPY